MAYGSVNADVITTSTAGGVLGAGNASIMKNRIINGAMVISQVGTSATISTTKQYIPDRWGCNANYTSGSTVAQSTNAPTGFNNSCLITIGTGAAAGSSDYFRTSQGIEGYNIADLGWGTASAKTVTVSFWVKSSLTGTFGFGLFNTNTRCYVSSYTISAANTWEYKTVTIAGDTSGTWATDNTAGVYLAFDLGEGSSRSTSTLNSWQASNVFGLTGGVKLAATSGATWQLSGVQLEVGSSATGFEYVNYQTSLANCQRYYEIGNFYASGYSNATNDSIWSVYWRTTKRTAPTVALTPNLTSYSQFLQGGTVTVVTSYTDSGLIADTAATAGTGLIRICQSYTASSEL